MVRYVYDAWGNHKAYDENGSEITSATHIGNLNPFRYRGYYYDTETKLYFLKTRYYDPEIGRFITIDGIEYIDPETINGLNLYAYCGNNPVMAVDPNGTAKWWQWLLGGIIVVAAIALTVVTAGLAAPISAAVGGGMLGAIVGGAVVGAIGGAITSFAFSVASQGISNGFDNINWGQVGIATLSGAITGAVLGGIGGGIRYAKAAHFLKASGVPKSEIKNVMSSYKGIPKVRALKSDTTVYRVYGGESAMKGHWVSPNNYGASARELLALPDANTANKLYIIILNKGTVTLQGKAASLWGHVGGGVQWWVAILP